MTSLQKIIRLAAGLTSLCMIGLTACSKPVEVVDQQPIATATPEPIQTLPPTEPPTQPPTETRIHTVAVGDNLIQTAVYRTANQRSYNGEEYDFTYVYENVKPLINGDLNIINQETLICGEGYEVTGSNFNFNAPVQNGDAVIDMGFNAITMCNNHILDKGEEGLQSCLNYWDNKMAENPGLLVCGVYKGQQDFSNIRTMEVNGKKIAFVCFTENTNGYSFSGEYPLDVVYSDQTDIIQAQIEFANQNADVVVVTAHWGVEDTYEVTDGAKWLAQQCINWGADVIIGNHPHVAQTMEYLTRPDGTQGFVFYAMGNFVAAQTDNFNLISELADFDIVIDAAGAVTIQNVQVTPLIIHYEEPVPYDDTTMTNLTIYPYSMYSDELAAQHGMPVTTSNDGPEYVIWNMDWIRNSFERSVPAEFRKYE